MASTEVSGRFELARKNTFQRMLDLEQKNKVNRMQASRHDIPRLVHKGTAPERDSISSISNRDFRPPSLQATGRAMTTPALSVSIPPPMSNPNGNGTSRKYVISQTGDLIPQEEEDSEHDSDTSSICHSPGWDDLSGKKKKQEKKAREQRRKEKEKAEKELKAAQKAMAKLSKAPPANSSKKLSRMSVTIDRSQTTPVLPTVHDAKALPVEGPSPSRQSISTRPRRGSLEAGLKSFMSRGSIIPGSWKTSHSTPGPAEPAHEFVPSRTTSKVGTGDFIGGLKLRQSEEAATLDTIRKVKIGERNSGSQSTDALLKNSTNPSSNASIAESIRPVSIYEESIRSPQQWDDIYSQAAQMARGSRFADVVDDTPIMERNIKKARKKHHPPTSRYFPLESEDSNSSKRESSIASTRNSMTSATPSSDGRNSQVHTPSSADRPPSVGGNSSIDQPRGRGGDYVGHQRKQSREQSLARYEDEVRAAEVNGDSKKRTSSRGSFFRRSSRHRESSREAPSTIRPGTRDSSVDAKAKETTANPFLLNPFLSDEYVVPQLHLGDFTSSPLGDKPAHHRKTSSTTGQTFPGLKGLKVATKAAFSKQQADKVEEKSLGAPTSPTGSFVSAVETQATLRPKSSQRALTPGTIVDKTSNINKGTHFEAPIPPTIVQDFAVRPNSPPRSSPDTIRQRPSSRQGSHNSSPLMSNGNSSVTSHTRSTDSSEEYSTLENFSNITTPSISRPHSEKEYSRSVDELSRASNTKLKKRSSKEQGVFHNGINGHPMMSGAIQFNDAASQRDSWCRTAMPMDSSEGEDRMKTPTGKKRSTDFTTSREEPSMPRISDGPPPKTSDGLTNSSGIQRKPSIARSISTPDLQQDLSFLPVLKQQALTKPQKKSKGFLGRKSKQQQASVSSDTENSSKSPPTSLVRPSPAPISLPTPPNSTKSEGSSPTSSSTSPQQPSQYLQNARLNIHGGPRSPKFPPHPHSGNPHLNQSHNPKDEPVAKMFVVCCSCKYFHDMPSKIYECMAKPDNVVTDSKLGVSGVISTSVKCPWCGHGMSTSCCAGYAAVVYLREKFH